MISLSTEVFPINVRLKIGDSLFGESAPNEPPPCPAPGCGIKVTSCPIALYAESNSTA